MRWIWIDRFLEFHRGKSARAMKSLSMAEEFFADHFPGYPVMPGTLILEGLAQTGGILMGEVNDFQEKVVLAKVPWARFYPHGMVSDDGYDPRVFWLFNSAGCLAMLDHVGFVDLEILSTDPNPFVMSAKTPE